jgi:hypothetical protein
LVMSMSGSQAVTAPIKHRLINIFFIVEAG